jgi:4,5-dihydroxyphthalate decarboxylase
MNATAAASKSKDEIVLACRNSDATNAIVRGRLAPAGVNLRVVENNDVPKMFEGMARGDYDVAEMSMAEFIYYRSRGQADFIGIPVFPSRVFRHGYIYCNAAAGITSPELLSGKKIGFLRWVQTAFVWVRGMLVEDYGVSAKDTKWYTKSLHHWKEEAGKEVNDIHPQDGSRFYALEDRAGMDEYETICTALIDGRLDAIAVTENVRYAKLFAGNERVVRLFPKPRLEEAAYFKRTGIFPVMHLLAAREEVLAKNPGLAEQLFNLFSESKRIGKRWVRSTPSLALAWKDEYLEDEAKIFASDPWVFGLHENERLLSKFLAYCYDQGVSATKMMPRDLFARESWEFKEPPPARG